MQCDLSHAQILQMPVVLRLTGYLSTYLERPLREVSLSIRQSVLVRLFRQTTVGQLDLEVTLKGPSACRWRPTTTRR